MLLEWKTPAGAYSPAIQQAVAAAQQSDVAIVYANTIEGEARDRVSLHLPQSDDQLIQAVSAANPHTIVVLANAGPGDHAVAEQRRRRRADRTSAVRAGRRARPRPLGRCQPLRKV